MFENRDTSVEFKLPEYKIEIDLRDSYIKNINLLKRETLRYVDSIIKANRGIITKKKLMSLIELPKMTYFSIKSKIVGDEFDG